MAPAHWTRKCLPRSKCDAIAINKIIAPNMFIGYRLLFCYAASVSSVKEP